MKVLTKNNSKEDGYPVRIFDIAELSIYDGPGVRSVVYFQGCNAECDWCHSPQSQPISSPLMHSSGVKNHLNGVECTTQIGSSNLLSKV